jgi:hypothetical protein
MPLRDRKAVRLQGLPGHELCELAIAAASLERVYQLFPHLAAVALVPGDSAEDHKHILWELYPPVTALVSVQEELALGLVPNGVSEPGITRDGKSAVAILG